MLFPSPEKSLITDPASQARLLVQHRLIAVWALAEGFMGGILHGLHLPVTGLIVGSISVCCLALLSKVSNRRSDLLKATVLVLLVKAMLSPHSPPLAYFAVLSQGLLAGLLFSSSNNYKLNCYLLAILTQLQSALQHIIVVIVVFGLSFWQALDQYLNKLTGSLGLHGVSYALTLAGAYVALHLLTGIFTGWLAGKLPDWLQQAPRPLKTVAFKAGKVRMPLEKPGNTKMKRRFNPVFLLVWGLLVAVFLQSYFGLGPAILPKAKAVQILVRSVLIVSVWYFVISPFLMARFQRWLSRQQGPLQNQLQAILEMLPETQFIIKNSWQESTGATGFKRLRKFITLTGPRLFALPE